MAEPLKLVYSEAFIDNTIACWLSVVPQINTTQVKNYILSQDCKSLELKERSSRLSDAMGQVFPKDFEQATQLLYDLMLFIPTIFTVMRGSITCSEQASHWLPLNSTFPFLEGEKQKRINEAEGQASEILSVAEATAEGISKIAEAIQAPGGYEAVNLRVAEQYIEQFGKLAKEGNTLILPSDLTDVSSLVATATSVIKQQKKV